MADYSYGIHNTLYCKSSNHIALSFSLTAPNKLISICFKFVKHSDAKKIFHF